MFIGLGRRKEASAKITLTPGEGKIIITKRKISSYVNQNLTYQSIIYKPLESLGLEGSYDIIAQVKGGGLNAQLEAIQLATARALCKLNFSYRKPLKSRGFLTRDSRSKERRKYGLKKARKAPQFSKR